VEQQVLDAICQTLLPELEAGFGEHADLFHLDAGQLHVADALRQSLTQHEPRQRRRLEGLLRLLERPLWNFLLTGWPRAFTRLGQADRERFLSGLAVSRWAGLRSAFQALKRLAVFHFYTRREAGRANPTWEALSYRPPPPAPAGTQRLRLTTVTRKATLAGDVCVIGSGAGGSVVANELAAAGKRVIVLEAGSGWQAKDYDPREFPGYERLFLERGCAATHDLGVTILAGACLGGGTTVNWQTSLRPPPAVRQEWAEQSGSPHFIEPSFTRSLEAVSARLGVGTAESTVNANNATLRQGCEALGWAWETLPRNSRKCDPEQCGFCTFGCRAQSKQSAAVTYLHDGQKAGDLVVLAGCRAERLIQARGRVTGVQAQAVDAKGQSHEVTVRAARVVVAAGALHSPALLLRSGLQLPLLGRNLLLHPTTAVLGYYDEPIEGWRGPPQSILCAEFANLEANRGFRLECAPVHPGLLAAALPWFGARSHRRWMQQIRHVSVIIVLARDRAGGRVCLGSGGQPVAHYRPGSAEQSHLQQGIAAAVRVHLAAGAREVLTLHAGRQARHRDDLATSAAIDDFCWQLLRQPVADNRCGLFSAHQMGTCRMGRDRRHGVCDARGQVFGLAGLYLADASTLPTASGVNPMLSIMASAHHSAQEIKQE